MSVAKLWLKMVTMRYMAALRVRTALRYHRSVSFAVSYNNGFMVRYKISMLLTYCFGRRYYSIMHDTNCCVAVMLI